MALLLMVLMLTMVAISKPWGDGADADDSGHIQALG